MENQTSTPDSGEELIKQELITREELAQARETEARSGVPWYKSLIQNRKIGFETLENVLRYEFHSRSAHSAHQTLGETLLRRKCLSKKQLDQALAEQKRSGRLLGSILLEKGFVSSREIGMALAEQYGAEYADVDQSPSDAEALEAVPESMAVKNGMLPLHLNGDRLVVLVTTSQARERASEAGVLLGKRIHSVMTACDDLEGEIRARYRELAADEPERVIAGAEKSPLVKQAGSGSASEDAALETTDVQRDKLARFAEVAKQAEGAPIVRMVATILEGAVNAGATDIHLDPQEPETRVRYRIDGVLHDVMSLPRTQHNAVVSRIKILADMDITETRHPQDGHFSDTLGGKTLDIRVATLPTFLGERAVLRLLDQSSVLSGIKDLGMEREDEEKILRLVRQPYGMILVTGPTGSGKTTTLYAALNQKDVMTESIVTLEDPVEYQLPGINQVQVDTDLGLTFASTLRAALRQDIDVLLVGEIRDQETAHIAIRAAMTGHLVFSTLHTNDALEALGTLRNMGIPPYLVSSALTAVIGQRLIRRICPECRKPFKPTVALLESLGLPKKTAKLFRGNGCPACHYTGNLGRTGIFEVFEVTSDIRKVILAEADIRESADLSAFKSMAERCRQKILAGIAAPEEYFRVIRD